MSERHWVFSGGNDTWWGQGLDAEKRKETFVVRTEARTLPRRTHRLLFVPRRECVQEKDGVVRGKRIPSPFREPLRSAFQRHRLRFKSILGRKSPGGRPMTRRSPGMARGSPPRATGGFHVPPRLPLAAQPHRFENLTLPPCVANCLLLPHVFTENHLLLELCAEVVAILTP